ncbi:MAG: transporter substrate-binding domain-containing protein, partial [Myxococcota bacterium]|nr:transporter substrate-binding domain-containing protein [Myxococcota bacterium]
MRTRPISRVPGAVLLLPLLALAAWPAASSGQADEARARDVLRVATSGDYAPFSVRREDGSRAGLDVEVARAFARDTGRRLRVVPLRWPALLEDLAAGRFDVAMSGVTVRPERSLEGRFSVPVATSGALVLAPRARAADGLAALDAAGTRIAVNAGGHLERAARAHFRRARVVPVPDNARVLERLRRGEVDAVVTDTLEAPHWEARLPGLARLGPFTRDRKAYLLPADAADLAAELDAWLLAREADGTLAALRDRALGEAARPTATPLAALVAAVDERLALMPLVAEAKRASG